MSTARPVSARSPPGGDLVDASFPRQHKGISRLIGQAESPETTRPYPPNRRQRWTLLSGLHIITQPDMGGLDGACNTNHRRR